MSSRFRADDRWAAADRSSDRPGRGPARPARSPAMPWRAAAVAVVGLILVGASVFMLGRDRAMPTDFGQVPAQGAAAPVEVAGRSSASLPQGRADLSPQDPPSSSGTSVRRSASVPSGPATRTPRTSRAGTVDGTTSAAPTIVAKRTTEATVGPLGVPGRILLPTQQVDAPVVQVGTSQGVLQVPDDPQRVGWWSGSALPGSDAGTTVLDGHIDSATAGVGAFWHLSELGAGATVVIALSNGQSLGYRVVARRVYAKSKGLPASLFASTGPPTLVLISCGGPFDSTRRSYEDNIAVFAVPEN